MNYQFKEITMDIIPDDIYLCNKSKWKFINYFQFDNGLKCIIGSNYKLSAKDAINTIKDEMNNVLDDNNNSDELQKYYYDNFNIFIPYSDCIKIYKYYNNNEKLIKEVFNTYFDKESN